MCGQTAHLRGACVTSFCSKWAYNWEMLRIFEYAPLTALVAVLCALQDGCIVRSACPVRSAGELHCAVSLSCALCRTAELCGQPVLCALQDSCTVRSACPVHSAGQLHCAVSVLSVVVHHIPDLRFRYQPGCRLF